MAGWGAFVLGGPEPEAEQRSNDGGSVGEFAFEMMGRAYLVNHKSGGPLSTSVPRGASFNN